ncbi:MAG: hypothetical protein ACT4QB_14605 [Gammaproteobacteria bacterium]
MGPAPLARGVVRARGMGGGRTLAVAQIAQARRFQGQYGALVRRAGEGCLVFCQVGRFVEFRGPQRATAERVLGLRRTYLPRGPYGFTAGFPVRWSGYYKRRAIEQGLTVVDVPERPAPLASGCSARAYGGAGAGDRLGDGSPRLTGLSTKRNSMRRRGLRRA